MEDVRTVLHVVILAAVATARQTPGKPSICSADYIQATNQFLYCDSDRITKFSSFVELFHNTDDDLTKQKVMNFLQDLCTNGIDMMVNCFAGRLKKCTPQEKAELMFLEIKGAGFVCQPLGNGIEPAVSAVLSRLSIEDLRQAVSKKCPGDQDNSCLPDIDREGMSSDMTPESASSVFQSRMETTVQCSVDKFQAMKYTCPHWRAALLLELAEFFLYPLLGLHLPYNTSELLNMFEL